MIGPKVKEHRKRRGWSLGQLAARSGVNRAYIGRIEKGRHPRPGAGTVGKLASALGIDPSELGMPAKMVPPPDLDAALAEIEARFPGLAGRFVRTSRGASNDDASMMQEILEFIEARQQRRALHDDDNGDDGQQRRA